MSLRGQLGFSEVPNRHYLGDKKPELSLRTEKPGGKRRGRSARRDKKTDAASISHNLAGITRGHERQLAQAGAEPGDAATRTGQ